MSIVTFLRKGSLALRSSVAKIVGKNGAKTAGDKVAKEAAKTFSGTARTAAEKAQKALEEAQKAVANAKVDEKLVAAVNKQSNSEQCKAAYGALKRQYDSFGIKMQPVLNNDVTFPEKIKFWADHLKETIGIRDKFTGKVKEIPAKVQNACSIPVGEVK